MAQIPPLAQLADNLLEGRLAAFLVERRSAGESWDTIAKRLWAATDERIDVNGVTVQGWFDRLDAEVPA